MWDEDSESWSVCIPGAEELEGGVLGRYWENETEFHVNVQGWLPMPELPPRIPAKP